MRQLEAIYQHYRNNHMIWFLQIRHANEDQSGGTEGSASFSEDQQTNPPVLIWLHFWTALE